MGYALKGGAVNQLDYDGFLYCFQFVLLSCCLYVGAKISKTCTQWWNASVSQYLSHAGIADAWDRVISGDCESVSVCACMVCLYVCPRCKREMT